MVIEVTTIQSMQFNVKIQYLRRPLSQKPDWDEIEVCYVQSIVKNFIPYSYIAREFLRANIHFLMVNRKSIMNCTSLIQNKTYDNTASTTK